MKKQILTILCFIMCLSGVQATLADDLKSDISTSIRMYKQGNYTQAYSGFKQLLQKDSSNPLLYYYYGMSATQLGKGDEALEAYNKVLTISPKGKLARYAKQGCVCVESPELCHQKAEVDALEEFLTKPYDKRNRFETGFTEKVRSDYEKNKIENLMREMNRDTKVEPKKFRGYEDFSSVNPTNDEIVAAIRVLQNAGMADLIKQGSWNNISSMVSSSDLGENNSMLNMFAPSQGSIDPKLVQTLLTNQMSLGF